MTRRTWARPTVAGWPMGATVRWQIAFHLTPELGTVAAVDTDGDGQARRVLVAVSPDVRHWVAVGRVELLP